MKTKLDPHKANPCSAGIAKKQDLNTPVSCTDREKVREELKQSERAHGQLCCHIAASLKWGGLGLTDADIKDTLATYFKTKERWIYKAG